MIWLQILFLRESLVHCHGPGNGIAIPNEWLFRWTYQKKEKKEWLFSCLFLFLLSGIIIP